MKIIIAPDSFKESLSAPEVAAALAKGIQQALPEAELIQLPVADGGEGTTQALVTATKGQLIPATVTGPMDEPVDTYWGLLGNGTTAVIETAAASGLHLVPMAQRNPLYTTSRGTGELILEALDYGVRHFIIGLGGSATNDGGAGLLQGLGLTLLDKNGRIIPAGGAGLAELYEIDTSTLDPRLAQSSFQIASDVTNPLIGPRGASAVFGPQKGATPDMVTTLDHALQHWAGMIKATTGKEVERLAGTGAAGGTGAALIGFCNATVTSGIELVLDTIQFDQQVQNAAWVITGEGRLDSQTLYGKTPIGVAQRAKRFNIPVVAIAGALSEDTSQLKAQGIDAIWSICPRPLSLEQALNQTAQNLQTTAFNIASWWAAARH